MHKARHRALVLLSHGVYTSSEGSALRTQLVVLFMCSYVLYFQVRVEVDPPGVPDLQRLTTHHMMQTKVAQMKANILDYLVLTNPTGDPACKDLQPTFDPDNPSRPHSA